MYGAALGSRGGTVTIKTCADGVGCSEEVLIAVRAYPSFRNVTKELLYIYVDLDGDGVAERNPLGWAQTRTVFERYNISAPNDLCDTAVRLNLRCAPNVNVAILGVTTHRPTVLSAPARLVAEEI